MQVTAFLAAMAAAAAQAQAPPSATSVGTSPPVVVTATPKAATITLDVGANSEMTKALLKAYPSMTVDATQDGHVELNCRVDRHGLAEWCEVASEKPKGVDYGKVALQMRPLLKLKPPELPPGVVSVMMPVAIDFKHSTDTISSGVSSAAGSPTGLDGAENMVIPQDGVTMINTPAWRSAPSFQDLARAYPPEAKGVEGYAVLHCTVAPRSGEMGDCNPLTEYPENSGFGRAAMRLSGKFRMDVLAIPRGGHYHLWVDIPVRFTPPTQISHEVDAPIWLGGMNPESQIKLFPPEAIAKGLTTGRGVVHCKVGENGALHDCTAVSADPDGLGFSEAAAKLAATMRMNLWSQDGAPTADGEVDVPIRLKLKPGA